MRQASAAATSLGLIPAYAIVHLPLRFGHLKASAILTIAVRAQGAPSFGSRSGLRTSINRKGQPRRDNCELDSSAGASLLSGSLPLHTFMGLMPPVTVRTAALLTMATAAVAAPAAADEDVGEFYKGKTITISVGTESGNSYDIYTRTLARHLSRHLPGNPSVIVQNSPGAGGLNNANTIYNVAPKDGTALGQVQNTVPFEPFYENPNARFDATKMSWLGSPGRETGLLIIWHSVPVHSVEDARRRGLTLGATGVASTPAFYARVINAVLGIPIKLIVGYKSQNESFLAMERGENEGYSSTFWSSLKLTKPEWIALKQVTLLLQYGGTPAPDLKSVPFAADLIKDENDRRVMQIASAPLTLGRPIFAPPGVPAERVAALRQAVADTYRDPAYLADCTQQHLECTDPSSGAELDDLLGRTYAASEATRARLRDIYSGQK